LRQPGQKARSSRPNAKRVGLAYLPRIRLQRGMGRPCRYESLRGNICPVIGLRRGPLYAMWCSKANAAAAGREVINSRRCCSIWRANGLIPRKSSLGSQFGPACRDQRSTDLAGVSPPQKSAVSALAFCSTGPRPVRRSRVERRQLGHRGPSSPRARARPSSRRHRALVLPAQLLQTQGPAGKIAWRLPGHRIRELPMRRRSRRGPVPTGSRRMPRWIRVR
jgi:hypothetical protein